MAQRVTGGVVEGIRPVGIEYPITCEFGRDGVLWNGGKHKGIDFGCPVGSPVKAYADGVVIVARRGIDGLGLRVTINNDDFNTLYAHLSDCYVKLGDKIRAGEMFALSGQSGERWDGEPMPPHLHFEVRVKGVSIEPKFV
jgi:murein DD-endopeptidase MepM/ murein hydrolase activator NlpD